MGIAGELVGSAEDLFDAVKKSGRTVTIEISDGEIVASIAGAARNRVRLRYPGETGDAGVEVLAVILDDLAGKLR